MKKLAWKNLKLGTKVSACISAILVVIFAAFIVIAVTCSQNAIQDATFGELAAVASDTGSQIEGILQSAENTTNGMVAYIQDILSQSQQESGGEDQAPVKNPGAAEADAMVQAAVKAKVDALQGLRMKEMV